MLIPQRYEFSSKSQPVLYLPSWLKGCCWYHKGTNFQANHNPTPALIRLPTVVADTTKVRIFKQITTKVNPLVMTCVLLLIPQRYEFSSKSQPSRWCLEIYYVVADTTKVRIFKQITTSTLRSRYYWWLLLIPQRYEFSSKSQPGESKGHYKYCCCWYHKGTNFQANHNQSNGIGENLLVVADTTKVRIFKQITTKVMVLVKIYLLLLIPQRYEFSSKSQRQRLIATPSAVVFDNAKILILKLITTWGGCIHLWVSLYLIMQRYQF